ncbi:MAG: NAD-dependent epimerase/dehydratase family protein, partial [Promethearchaeota archaeon]
SFNIKTKLEFIKMVKIKARTILLTGAFGNVGMSTLKELVKRGYNIRAFEVWSLKNKKAARKFKQKIEIFWGDLRNYSDVEKAVKDVDVVIHLAAIIPPIADENHELARDVNIGGTKNIIQALEKLSQQTKLIFSSSISVYGDRLKNPYIKLEDPLKPSPGDYYAVTKLQCEDMIRHSHLDWAIFRLTYITSVEKLEMDPLLFHMPLNTSIEICWNKDVAYALANAIECEVWGEILHIGGGKNCRTSFRDYLNKMTELYGLGKDLLPGEAFAKDNFHCGYYDTKKSQKLLKYQRHSLNNFYKAVKNKLKHLRRFFKLFYFIIRPSARLYLLSRSEYYKKKNESKSAMSNVNN